MIAAELLADLRRLGVRLWAEGERLRYQAPKGVLIPELRSELVERKEELLELLRRDDDEPGGTAARLSADLVPAAGSASQRPAYTHPRNPDEAALAKLCSEVLGIERVGVYDNFFEIGGDSLSAVRLGTKVQDAFGVELPLRCLFESTTIARLAHVIGAVRDGNHSALGVPGATDPEADAILDPAIKPPGTRPAQTSETPNIFLTGATGFLGAYLLSELLQKRAGNVFCLVRAASEEEGGRKLRENLESYSLWQASFGQRVIPVPGDLSQPFFGLPPEKYQTLACDIDVIYHNAAAVNFVHPYAKLKAANVLGTEETLRLASQFNLKPLHHVSTLAVFFADQYVEDKLIGEQEPLPHSSGLSGGYEQSKLIAERLVDIARSRGIPVSVYRPGMVTGHAETGFCNTDDLVSGMIKAFIRLGSAPDLGWEVEMTPVDYVSKAIVHLSGRQELLGQTFHLVNTHRVPLKEVVGYIRSRGYKISELPFEKWRAEMTDAVRNSGDRVLAPLLPLLYESGAGGQPYIKGAAVNYKMPRFDCRKTLDALAGASITCPSLDSKLLDTYFSYFTRAGFLDAPHGSAVTGRVS